MRYGGHQHAPDEVNLVRFEVETRYSPRGREMTKRHRMHIIGELLAVGQAALATKIETLVNAYSLSNPDQTVGLYHDDGTITRHRLESSAINSNNLTGVRVVHRSWPKGEPEEYATQRTFHIILEAEYRNLESQLLHYHERVRRVGTCGPKQLMVEYAGTRLPEFQLICQKTSQEIIQEGFAIGFDGWYDPLLNGPGPLFPALELGDLREITPDGPDYLGRAFGFFRMDWRYVMQSNINQSAFPVIL